MGLDSGAETLATPLAGNITPKELRIRNNFLSEVQIDLLVGEIVNVRSNPVVLSLSHLVFPLQA